MRIALLLMLFHFYSPLSSIDACPDVTDSKERVDQIELNSIATPILLKEKDEKNSEVKASDKAQITLLDLRVHELNLQARHSIKSFYVHAEILYEGQPPLFTFLRAMLI